MVKEGSVEYKKEPIRGSHDLFKLMVELFRNADREEFWVVSLDCKHRPINANLVSVGSLSVAIVHPREVFKAAILSNAKAILLSHNHPSGDCKPSEEDYALTARLSEAGKVLGIDVLDHVVVGDNCYHSFADQREL